MIGAHERPADLDHRARRATCPERVLTNDELSTLVDTNDEWIIERTGIRERRHRSRRRGADRHRAARARGARSRWRASTRRTIDLLIVATVTPDMAFPSSAALIADELGMPDAAAYDLSAGCTGFVYAIAQAHGMLAAGLAKRALVVGGDVLSKILDWTDRSTLVLFGDGAGAVVMEQVEQGGFLGFELGADGGGGANLWLPGSGSRKFDDPDEVREDERPRGVQVRDAGAWSRSAEAILDECGRTVDDVDVYVPHQANVRIIDHAVEEARRARRSRP